MKFVIHTNPGQLELNWTWLPTWIGMNESLIREIEEKLRIDVVGKELTKELLEWAHCRVITILTEKFPLQRGLFDYLKFPLQRGLFDYLEGIKFVRADGI
jgi:hypothetical protein